MSSEAKRKYFSEVLREVKFRWDHDEIRKELDSHILDECEYLEMKGITGEAAESEALKRMGSPKKLGQMLNQAHNPWIGRLWLLTNVLLVIVGIAYLFNMWNLREMERDNLPFGWSPAANESVIEMHKEDEIFHVTCSEVLNLETYQIRFTDVQCIRNTGRDIYTRDNGEYVLYIFFDRTGEGGEEAITYLTPAFFLDDQGRTLAWSAPWLDEDKNDWDPGHLDGAGGVYGATYSANEMGRFRVYGFEPGTKYIDVIWDLFGQRASCRLDLSEVTS